MRWTRSLITTLRDDPQEAEIASHKLMLRAAFIRKLSGGLYTFLPPILRGVAGATRRERLWQAAPRYAGGIVLALLAGLSTLAAGAPGHWTIAEASLSAMSALTLLAIPPSLGLPWHKLAGGMLLAAGLLLS